MFFKQVSLQDSLFNISPNSSSFLSSKLLLLLNLTLGLLQQDQPPLLIAIDVRIIWDIVQHRFQSYVSIPADPQRLRHPTFLFFTWKVPSAGIDAGSAAWEAGGISMYHRTLILLHNTYKYFQ